MSEPARKGLTRRRFLSAAAAATTVTIASPAVLTASKTQSKIIVGTGDYRYEVHHNWPQLPGQFRWQTTHNVAVDRAGRLYVIHEGHTDKPDHPSIFVFDGDGKYIRSFGSQFQGGGHGIEVREEDGQEFLYVCAYQQVKAIAKLDLNGETVWQQHAPMQAGVYADGEDTCRKKSGAATVLCRRTPRSSPTAISLSRTVTGRSTFIATIRPARGRAVWVDPAKEKANSTRRTGCGSMLGPAASRT